MEYAKNTVAPADSSLEDERPSKRRKPSTHHPPPREVGLMRSIPGDRLSSFVGSASGIYFIRSVYSAIRGTHSAPSTQGETLESEIVPGEDDHLPSVVSNTSGHLWSEHEVTSSREMSSVSFQELIEWSGSYFANWHPFYPYLHAPTVLDYFEQMTRDDGHPEDDSSNFRITILRAIMSISLADCRQSDTPITAPYPAHLVFESYDAAVDSLQSVLSRPTTLQSLQAAISVQLFLVSMLRLNAASRLGGLVIRMALQLGLHRCPTRFPAFKASEKEHRQRIFWSLYAIDRFICQSMGLPLSLHDDDVDVCYPTAERHPGSQPTGIPPDFRLTLMSLLARHYTIRSQIIELRNKSLHYVHKDPNRAIAITAQLTQWGNDVDDLHDSAATTPTSPYQLLVLTILKHEAIISLNRPALAAARNNSPAAHDAALHYCIGSARAIITALHNAIKPTSTSTTSGAPQTPPLSLLWPSLTWAVWISTFIVFHAGGGGGGSAHISRSAVQRLSDRALEVLRHLARRGSVWAEACAAAVRDLRGRIGAEAGAVEGERRDEQEKAADADTDTSNTGLVDSHVALPPPPPPPPPPSRQQQQQDTAHTAASATMTYGAVDPLGFDLAGNASWDAFMQASGSAGGLGFEGIGIGIGAAVGAGMGGEEGTDPCVGFDIPFWLGQDQYWGMVNYNERGGRGC